MESTSTVNASLLQTWLSQPIPERLLDIALLAFLFGFVLYSIVKFVNALNLRPTSIKSKNTVIDFKGKFSDVEDKNWTLLNHKIFRILETVKNTQYYVKEHITNKDIINTAFLRDCVFASIEDELISFIQNIERKEGEGLEHLPELINKWVDKQEIISKKTTIVLIDGTEICGIPNIYVTKFNAWNSDHIKLCLEGIQNVLSDKLYVNSWKYRASTCLEYMSMIVQLILTDAQRTLSSLNGDLDKRIAEMIEENKGGCD